MQGKELTLQLSQDFSMAICILLSNFAVLHSNFKILTIKKGKPEDTNGFVIFNNEYILVTWGWGPT